jgi:hypothetical protein
VNGILTKIVLAVVLGVLALASPAKADDPVQQEMWRLQNKLNQLTEQRIANLEKRVALLEQKVPTAYQPGYTPPAPTSTPSYAPAYSPTTYAPASPPPPPPAPPSYSSYAPVSPPTPTYVGYVPGPGGWDMNYLRRCYGENFGR